jgi:tetratricopeptide (TPR) repeat protein
MSGGGGGGVGGGDTNAPPRLKAIVTLLVLLVTLTASVAGYVAHRASIRAESSARQRQLLTIESQRQLLSSSQATFAAISASDLATELGWRGSARLGQATDSPDGAERERLQAESDAYYAEQKKLSETVDDEVGRKPTAERNRAGWLNEEKAGVWADHAEDWVHHEESLVTVVGFFAVALFLLGLTLTLQRARMRGIFVTLAIVIWAAGTAWGAAVVLQPVRDPPRAALTSMVDGRVALQAGETDDAIKAFRTVTDLRPEYAQGHNYLAAALRGSDEQNARAEAVEELREAVHLTPNSGVLRNNLADAEVLARDKHAVSDAERAVEMTEGKDVVALFTLSEAHLGAGDVDASIKVLDQAIGMTARHGSGYRDLAFGTLRNDIRVLGSIVKGAGLDRFQRRVGEAEASLDMFNSDRPKSLDGARLTDMQVRKAANGVGVVLHVSWTGIAPGRKYAVRWYGSDDRLQPGASYRSREWTEATDGTADLGPFDLVPGPNRVELYLDGNLLASAPYDYKFS